MKINCPNCGELIEVNNLGRRPLNIGVIIVCDKLQSYGSVPAAADNLKCSRGYIYKVLKDAGLTAREVLREKVPA